MKTKHYVLIGIAVAFSLLPAIAPSLLSVAIIGALIGLLAAIWTLREVDAESRRLKEDIKKAEGEAAKAREERLEEKIPNTRAPYHVTFLVRIDATKRVKELAA